MSFNPLIESAIPKFTLIPLFGLMLALAAGILAARVFDLTWPAWLVLTLIATAATIVWVRSGDYQRGTIAVVASFVLAGALSAATDSTRNHAPNRIAAIYDAGRINFDSQIELTGRLRREPEETPDGFLLWLEAEKIKFQSNEQTAAGQIRLTLPIDSAETRRFFDDLQLHYAARIKVAATITREDRFRNIGTQSFRQILQMQDLDATGLIKRIGSIEKLNDAPRWNLLTVIYRLRIGLINRFRRYFDSPTTGIMAASLLNNRYFLDKTTSDNFRDGGTFHVLVISGVHITFIGFLAAWLMRRLTKNLVAQFIAANVFLWTFAFAVGAEVPVTRAAAMFTILHLGALFYREATALNSFGAVGLLLLAWRPADLFDVSFQLTFASVGALVAFAFPLFKKLQAVGEWRPSEETPVPPICPKWVKNLAEILFWSERKWQRAQRRQTWKARLFKSDLAIKCERWRIQSVLQFVFASIAVSLIITMFLLPLTTIYFHRFSPAGLVLNVFTEILMAAETFVALFALLVAQISETLARPFIALTEMLNAMMTFSVEPFRQIGVASFRVPIYSGWAKIIYLVYYLPIISLTIAVNRWNPFEISNLKSQISNRKLIYALLTAHGLLLTVILFHPFSDAITNGELRVDFLDVGQGDSALITTPRGTKFLIDGGGRPDFRRPTLDDEGHQIETFEPDARGIGEAVVSEFLWQNGVSQVDFIMPTHADADHIDGLNDVAKNFTVRQAFAGRTPPNRREFQRFTESLQTNHIPLEKLARGETFEIDDVKFQVLSPTLATDETAKTTNNDSVVLLVIYGARRFLFTGDAEAEAERQLLEQPENLISDVVKVAHHGSKTSSIPQFIAATKARFAVISVGRQSPYGHPKPEIVQRWLDSNATVMTTGQNGTITFTTDGESLRLQTFVDDKKN